MVCPLLLLLLLLWRLLRLRWLAGGSCVALLLPLALRQGCLWVGMAVRLMAVAVVVKIASTFMRGSLLLTVVRELRCYICLLMLLLW